MAASASGSARDEVVLLAKEVELECGDISASQEGLLARSSFLGGGGEEEAEVFSTPPLTQGEGGQQEQQQEEEDAITMCTFPFTQSPSSLSASSSSSEGLSNSKKLIKTKQPRKPRVCTRKVRGAWITTPSPIPDRRNNHDDIVDPLYRAVLTIPSTTTSAPAPAGDLLALARQRGIFF